MLLDLPQYQPQLSSLKPAGKLRRLQVRVLCRLALRGGVKQERLAELFGVSRPFVSMVRTGKRWGWLTEDLMVEEELRDS